MAKSSFAFVSLAATTAHGAGVNNHANPIRKVVTLLQNLQTKVEGEGEKEQEMHEKYMCYCKSGAESLEKSVADAGPKISQLESAIKAAEAKKAGLDSEIANHQADQASAKKDMAEATGLREQEQAQHDSALAEEEIELGPINDALAALEKGAGASFIQSSAAQALKKVVQTKNNMSDADRTDLIAFLSDGADSEYAPADSEIIAILKTMKDEVTANIADLKKDEEASIKSYDGVMAAKNKELAPIQEMIEEKRLRSGQIPVDVTEMKHDLGDTVSKSWRTGNSSRT